MTPFIKKKEVKKDWYIVNAENAAVGRLASFISKVLNLIFDIIYIFTW